ncbi:MAG: hypothetical protein A3B99_01480 [Candidatus Yanofskybacteria bacterium RIFCSPHIGHO2_02_FULL_44_12b]|uniref:SCP domain-containing protein n=2 Tax=Candidatus Yanofskyibacteriota TaxID=1752733 RepID=A0A1F8GIQ6_9BACT|nr:MAG: SCP-like protein extracellular [Candidatus Yanofskybacteria bacterium GW2011_GWA2_44_9]OGN05600.1 MAG: hypothetical protein A2659_04820 [Candidatus Yanofskybacteria bacterium RIFCSPHIGHO2_01_FULL_44_24]OGN14005.1 MAG: hypothetical protein A3B99_01480 [Candidatus Yanofskybacteria bacterium RIFCSPHIGHO2_02_FULL_44_12b]OGN25274.1 MAG: hypothetical protein A2925_01600 [Candidatus Yanofskybacteria bacterium RIFCSPLOWO2_01_FULL_44_22]
MKKSIVILVVLGISGLFLYLVIKNDFKLPGLEEFTGRVQELKKEFSVPPPLRSSKDSDNSFLTRSGVLQWTNIQRNNNGFSSLAESAELNSAAGIRAKDMFENQYFAHESPIGKDVGYAVDVVHYQYLMIGENLALGNFKDDQELVQAWMDSPGHRANILNERYEKIGISVLRGVFEGKTTWIAVQVFGRPVSACPQPDSALKTRIEFNESRIESLKSELDQKKEELENTRPKRGPDYNQKVEEYNILVEEYNNLVSETKQLISRYNDQIQAVNQCISGG